MFRRYTILFLILTLSFAFSASAQPLIDPNTGLPTGIDEQLSVTITPETPDPGDEVTITVESFSTNLNGALIRWTLNGNIQIEERGAKTFKFTAPQSGSISTIVLRIAKAEGGVLTRTFSIEPAGLELVYEAQTYTPPFYKGRAMFTNSSTIKVVAFPEFITSGGKISSSNLIYTWEENGIVNQAASGYGKDTFITTGKLIDRPLKITATVKTTDSEMRTKKSIDIVSSDPQVLLYENNPIYGIIFERALSRGLILDTNEVAISAIPYHFSANEKIIGDMEYRWKLNGRSIASSGVPSEVVFRRTNEEIGIASIELSVSHLTNFLQAAFSGFTLELIAPEDGTSSEEFEF